MSAGGPAGVWLLARRSLRQHALSSCVTAIAAALACGLVMSVLSIQRQARDAFTGGDLGFDAVLGARGSPLQLVLNAVFHLEASPGNIPWAMYEEVRKRPYVQLAVPYAVGDNYQGFRIVGTTSDLFEKSADAGGLRFALSAGSRLFDPQRREAVVGSFAAQRSRLRVGDVFNPTHGLAFDAGAEVHPDEYVVVGVLEPTNSPADRVIFIPIEGVFRMEGHVLRGAGAETRPVAGQAIRDEDKEVSAVLLKLKHPNAGLLLDGEVNQRGRTATLAWPIGRTMIDLFNKMGWVSRILELVAYLVAVVAAAGILAALYNTINERRREFAILRALGARRGTVMSAIVVESAAIAGLGALGGFVVYAAILTLAAGIVRARTGVALEVWQFHHVLWAAPLGMTLLGAAAGLLPAIRAYATDVATHLSN
jgi:putative ABC transport system permease protein